MLRSIALGAEFEHVPEKEIENPPPLFSNKDPRITHNCSCTVDDSVRTRRKDVSTLCGLRVPSKLHHPRRATKNFFRRLTRTKRDASGNRLPEEINVTTNISVTSELNRQPCTPNTPVDNSSPLTSLAGAATSLAGAAMSTADTAQSIVNFTASRTQIFERPSNEPINQGSLPLSEPQNISFRFPTNFQPASSSSTQDSEQNLLLRLEEGRVSHLEAKPSPASSTTSVANSVERKEEKGLDDTTNTLERFAKAFPMQNWDGD
jgi:hypothetical protein